MKLSIDKIIPNPRQPRKTFDPVALGELADSIASEGGLINWITVRRLRAGLHEIVAGERRWRAHKLLVGRGLSAFAKIDCRIISADTIARDIIALAENLQRADVPPLEEAAGFQRLIDAGLTPAEIAKRLGIAEFRVTWRLRLLNLDSGVRTLFETGQLDRQQAMEIARLPAHADQRAMVRRINTGGLTGWKATRTAVDTALGQIEQVELFTDANPPAAEDLRTVRGMETKIDSAIAAVGAGWRDGACIIATKVDPGRATLMADKLDALAATLRTMSRELRNSTAQAPLSLAAEAA